MVHYLFIALGSALGGVARHWLGAFTAQRWGEAFPLGTLLANVSGSFCIGLLFVLTGPGDRWAVSPELRNGLLVGVLGGYTTFSSFSLQTLHLARDGQWLAAGLNVILSLALCLGAVWLGFALGQTVNR
jgi:fluoride exporter